jgi:hypothetical protein
MRIVLDTNVVVSALIWGGTPFTLLQAAIDGKVSLYTSTILLEELGNVLHRSHLASRLSRQQQSVEQALELYAGLANIVRRIRRSGSSRTILTTIMSLPPPSPPRPGSS